MANWSNPTLTSLYTDFVTEVKNRDVDLALGLDPATTSPTNVPTNAIRWNSASFKYQKWDGSTWNDLSAKYIFTAVEVSGATVPVNGMYLSTTNTLNFSTASTASRLTIDGSGNVNIDSGTFYVDAVNNRVGIGTTGPSSPLHVYSVGNTEILIGGTQTPILNLIGGAGTDPVIGYGVGALRFGTTTGAGAAGFSEKMTLDASGNLGLGVVPSANGSIYYRTFELGKAGCGLFVGTSSLSGSELTYFAGNAVLSYNAGPLWSYGNAGGAAAYGIEDGVHKWLTTTTTGTTGGAITFTQAMTLNASGSLLLGTTSSRGNFYNGSSGYDLYMQVESINYGAGCSYVRNSPDSASAVLIFGKTRSGSLGGNAIVANNDSIGTISFQGSDGSEFVELANINGAVDGTPGANDMPGRLVFSTTADGAASPTERMRIGNSGTARLFTSNYGLLLGNSQSAGTTYTAFEVYAGSTNTTSLGTLTLQIYNNGNVQNTNNSYGAISDIKLKENIVAATSQWSDIKALQVRKYNFKEGQTHTQIGLIAQEVELVSPGLVSESPDRDQEGNDLSTVTKSVNYSVLYMKAVKALQEAMERIETLEAKVAALESR